VFIPIGGGGLAAGVSAYIKNVRPEIKVIGVEAEDSACMKAAVEKGRRVVLKEIGIFADGVAVAQAGKETFRLVKTCVDEIITATTDEICAAIKDIFDDTRSIAEPAGALALAGLKKYVQENEIKGQTLVAIDSGANVNFDRLRHISERSEMGEKREGIFAVTIPERPGSFKTFCNAIGKRSITEFNYRYADQDEANIFVGVQLKNGDAERLAIVEMLKKLKYPIVDLTDNEMAKVHIRHMVGGSSPNIKNEVVYCFVFPERPGALLQFLQKLGQRWNISLFHYRNHGAAYGRAMVGLQVPPKERKLADEFLDELGYTYTKDRDNQAYKIFLT
jgi:threonine dehydratase